MLGAFAEEAVVLEQAIACADGPVHLAAFFRRTYRTRCAEAPAPDVLRQAANTKMHRPG
jgi:hypothetical protein